MPAEISMNFGVITVLGSIHTTLGNLKRSFLSSVTDLPFTVIRSETGFFENGSQLHNLFRLVKTFNLSI